MKRLTVNHIASVVIVYKKSDPSQIFIEIKDDTHPLKAVRLKLCPIGGNWIGESGKNDKCPKDTLIREIREELSFVKTTRTSDELLQCIANASVATSEREVFDPVVASLLTPTEQEIWKLNEIREIICHFSVPFGDFFVTLPRSVFDRFDPENKRDGFSPLITYFECGLEDEWWNALVALQQKFGNLSNESITLITSLDRIVDSPIYSAFGHEHGLKAFFLRQGFAKAIDFPLIDGIGGYYAGVPLESYEEYLRRYEVLKKP